MILSAPDIKLNLNKVSYEVKITDSKLPELLWYEVDAKFESFISESLDAALAALLIPAMYHQEDIFLKGKVSEDLFFQINNDIQSILLQFLPQLKRIKVHPDGFHKRLQVSDNVATGFSGGIDTFYTMAEHYYSDHVPEGYKISHFFYNNVGSHGGGGQRLWEQRLNHLKALPEKLGIPVIGVNSNLQDFYHDFTFVKTHTLRDASVGLLLQNGIGKYLYSSSINYDHLEIGPHKVITFADSILLPKLSTNSISILSIGSSVSRMNKIIRVSEIQDSWSFLDVCVNEENEFNCSHCFKCMKTQLALDVIGKLRNYDNVFNYEVYKKNRFKFITQIQGFNSLHLKEILEFAKRYNYPIPISTKFLSFIRLYSWRRVLRSFFPKKKGS